MTGSVGASEQTIKHSYLSAVGQSGIAAGDGGFDIRVKGGTELVGAAITSSAPASDNRLTTASLTSRDLRKLGTDHVFPLKRFFRKPWSVPYFSLPIEILGLRPT